jgi:CelD/BcsL family acetyltransferase involved in cellulose biosynthesis
MDLAPDVTVVRGADLTPAHLRALSGLRAADKGLASPYFCAEFLALVASLRDDVRVGLVHRDGRVVAVFPFQAGEDGAGEPLAHPASDFHGVVAAPGAPLEAARLIHACGLRSWSFHHVLAGQELFRPYHAATRASPYLDLGGGFEAYARQRRQSGTRQLRQVEASRRKLAVERGELRFVAHAADPEVLGRLRAWKEEQFSRRGWGKEFSPWVWSLLRALLRTETTEFAGMLSALYAGGELVAAHVGMRSRTCWHYWYPAFDPRFARYQPGLVLLLEMARHAADLGVTRIDLGAGDEHYKVRLANASDLVARGRVEARAP